MARRALWFGPLLVLVTYLLAGGQAATGAAAGAAVVVANFVLSGWSLSWAARRSPQILGGMAMAGFLLRLAGLTALVWALLRFTDLDRTGLLAGIGVTYLGLLISQARRELQPR